MITIHVRPRSQRVLSLDVESRPLHWIANDYVSKEITAIACRWADEPRHKVYCWTLGHGGLISLKALVESVIPFYDEADIICGHYIRGFDLPLLNACCAETGLRPLSDKLTHDTKLDLIKMQGISLSQKNLSSMLGVKSEKLDMDQRMWRSANRLEPEGIALARERVIADVHQNL